MIIDAIIIGFLTILIILITYSFAHDIFLISLIVFLLFYLVYITIKIYFWKRKKPIVEVKPVVETKVEEKPKESFNNDRIELKDYVKYNIHYGQTPQKVRQALEKEGWPKDKIDGAFLDYYNEAKI